MKIVFEIASRGQKLFCYISTQFAYIILSGGTKSSTSYLKKKIVLSKIVPGEILKIKYCLVEKKKKKRENYICLWKTSIISIRATEVNLVIKQNQSSTIREGWSSWPYLTTVFCQNNEDGKHNKNEYFTLGLQSKNKGSFEHVSLE